jgi:homoserine O-acetyltransferase
MLCYRTPESFAAKFQRTTNEELAFFNVEMHHENYRRFQLALIK